MSILALVGLVAVIVGVAVAITSSLVTGIILAALGLVIIAVARGGLTI